jgi:hypothetical protein
MDLTLLTETSLDIIITSPVTIIFPNIFCRYLLYTTPYLSRDITPICSIYTDNEDSQLIIIGIDHECAKIDLTMIPECYQLEWARHHHGFLSPTDCPEGKTCPFRINPHHSVAYNHGHVHSYGEDGHKYGWLVLNSKFRITSCASF